MMCGIFSKEKNNKVWVVTDKGEDLATDLVVVGKRAKVNSG
jgi:hypothetical protein